MKKTTALDSFIAAISEMNIRLDELKEFAENHMNYDPESINWSHVAEAQHFLSALTELTDMAYRRGEYAD